MNKQKQNRKCVLLLKSSIRQIHIIWSKPHMRDVTRCARPILLLLPPACIDPSVAPTSGNLLESTCDKMRSRIDCTAPSHTGCVRREMERNFRHTTFPYSFLHLSENWRRGDGGRRREQSKMEEEVNHIPIVGEYE